MFYLELFEILRFSEEFHSDSIGLIDDGKCAKKGGKGAQRWGHSYTMADIEPVFEGIHCWRVKVDKTKTEWIMFAIGQKREHTNLSYEKGMKYLSFIPNVYNARVTKTQLMVVLRVHSIIHTLRQSIGH